MAAVCFNAIWGYTTNSVAVALIVVVRGIDIAAVEVEVVGVRGIVHGRRPIVAVRTLIVETAIVPVAAVKELK